MSKAKQMFVIPILIYNKDDDERNERLGLDNEIETKLANLQTTHIDAYWFPPNPDKKSDIRFYVGGHEFRTPYSHAIIDQVIHPAMHVRAADEELDQGMLSPN